MAAKKSEPTKVESANEPHDTGVQPSVDEVQQRMDEIQDQGYQGTTSDSTPNEAYTVAGVTSGMPTPETDKAAAAEVREHQEQLSTDLAGPSGK